MEEIGIGTAERERGKGKEKAVNGRGRREANEVVNAQGWLPYYC